MVSRLDRTGSLLRLLQVQEDFQASVKDMLEGLDGLWARLELLHTGVTLSKEGSRGHKDLASASTDAEVSKRGGGAVVLPRTAATTAANADLLMLMWRRRCPQSSVTTGKGFSAARLT